MSSWTTVRRPARRRPRAAPAAGPRPARDLRVGGGTGLDQHHPTLGRPSRRLPATPEPTAGSTSSSSRRRVRMPSTSSSGRCRRALRAASRSRRGRPGRLLLQPDVGAPVPGHELGPGVEGRLPVELALADPDQAAGLRAGLGQLAPRRRAGPAGRPGSRPPRRCRSWSAAPSARAGRRAPRTTPSASGLDGEAGVVDRARADARSGSARRGGAAGAPLLTSSAIANISSCSPSWVTALTSKTRQPRASRSGRTMSARSRPSGTSILFSDDQPGPVARGRRTRPARPRWRRCRRPGPARSPGVARVDHVDQHRAALDVPQELQAQALAGGRARDQAGHVGDGEGVVAGLHHAEVGHQGGERVVGDLRPGRGDAPRSATTCRPTGSRPGRRRRRS